MPSHSDESRSAATAFTEPVFVLGPASATGARPATLVDAGQRPRYTSSKLLKDGSVAYYLAIPTWAKR